jgi:hypothetical protein
MSNWISLKDKKPNSHEVGDKVLLFRIMNDSQKEQSITIHETYMVKFCNENETWWQPLPLSPLQEVETYTEKYLSWLNRFFDYEIKILSYKSKQTGDRFSKSQILKRYEKAMLESPFNK